MVVSLLLWMACIVIATEAGPCMDNQHCSDCNITTGHCLTECDSGYFDQKCLSVCDGYCKYNLCTQSDDGGGRCTEGCIPGYQGRRCNIPCDSPGGNCTACPSGCDGGYCQLGSSCVSGCVDSYFGTDCESGDNVELTISLSTGLATASAVFIVMVVVAWCCSYCQSLMNDSFQLYVTPTHGMHAPTGVNDAPQYDVVDEVKMYDALTGEGQAGCDSRSGYVGLRSVQHTTTSRDLEHAETAEPGTSSVICGRVGATSCV
ncbi:cell death abnormality protein 1-like [Haliotis cracherodii]|uniref:cell death abnormality protein 1-like n=1 Tax=Haliotis cracherodii TaxID=6455 RepID=UPI0039ED447D